MVLVRNLASFWSNRPVQRKEKVVLLWYALVVGFAGVAMAVFAAGGWLAIGPLYPMKVGTAFAAMVAAALLLREEHPFPRLGPANRVTTTRAMLVALMAGAIGESSTRDLASAIVVLTATTAVLDGVDGWLARQTGMASAFGARIDMETDALLILVASILVWQFGKAGAWVLAGGLMRYAFVAAGWILPWMRGTLTPTMRAKTITIVHVIGLCVALAPIVPWPISAVAVGATTVSLGWSFAVDVGRLWSARAVS
jgi:phosphatidylglycerophosphate synthase